MSEKQINLNRREVFMAGGSLLALSSIAAGAAKSAKAQVAGRKPNILVIFGDDIGYWNISAYNRGMMGYRTPNIDRIAKEGAIFTDHLCPAVLHGGTRGVHHRAIAASAPAC